MNTKKLLSSLRRQDWKPLLLAIAIPLAVGGLSAILTRSGMTDYAGIRKPPLSPPSWVFPVVWTILFILMGIASYRVWRSESKAKRGALILYGIQLAVNFAWTLLFFSAKAYGLAFAWLLLLWALIVAMFFRFYDVDTKAAYLILPYLVWVTFAAYLSFGVLLLNA